MPAVVTSVMDVLQHELGMTDIALWMWTIAPDPELLLLATELRPQARSPHSARVDDGDPRVPSFEEVAVAGRRVHPTAVPGDDA